MLKTICTAKLNPTLYLVKYRWISKDIKFGREVKAMMLQGVNVLADTVSVTMGPKGRNVIIEQKIGPPKITKDGVTVAESIELKNKFMNVGAKLVHDIAKKTNDDAGDGTTTATVLSRSIANDGFACIEEGSNPFEIRKGILSAVNTIVTHLQTISKPIQTSEEIFRIASISANGDEHIGKLIADAMRKVGKEGVITIKDGRTIDDQIEIIEGMKFNRGFMSPYFINSMKGPRVEYTDAYVLYSLLKIFTTDQLVPALEICKEKKKPLLIIAEDIAEEPLSMLILNKVHNGLPVVAVKAPGLGMYRKETLCDMASATGGAIFEDELNLIRLEDCLEESLGKIGEITITKDSTLMVKGNGDQAEMNERIEEVKRKLEDCKSEMEKIQYLERLTRLQSKIAVILVAGSSEFEVNEKKDRVNDALNATRAALSEGIVPGGGTALLRCIPALKKLTPANSDQAKGINIVKNALYIPCKTIAENAGKIGYIVASEVEKLDTNYGYDANNDTFVDLMKNGIIDPLKVVKQALIDASGVASLLTTAEAVICNQFDEPKPRMKKFKKPEFS